MSGLQNLALRYPTLRSLAGTGSYAQEQTSNLISFNAGGATVNSGVTHSSSVSLDSVTANNLSIPLLFNSDGIGTAVGFNNIYNVNSVSGNNANNGNTTGAWATLAYAVTQVQPGDVVVLNGVFNESVVLQTSGTTQNLITWVGNHQTVIHGSGFSNSEPGIRGSGVSYNQFFGIEIMAFPGNGFEFVGECVGNKFEKNYVHHIKLSGFWITNNQAQNSLTILADNLITDIGLSCISLWFNYAGHYVLDNNTCKRWDGAIPNTQSTNFDGIHLNDTPYVHVVRNNLRDGDTSSTGDYIDVGGDQNVLNPHYTHHVVVEDNICTQQLNSGNTSARNKFNNHPKQIIGRYNKSYGLGWAFYEQPHIDCSLYNNTVVNALTHALQFWNANETSGYGGFAVKRNIFAYGNRLIQHLPDLIDGSPASILLDNNGYIPTLGGWDWATATTSSQYSAQTSAAEYERWRTETGQEPSGVGIRETTIEAQTFTDAINDDYSLVAGHSFINAGQPLTFAANSGSNSKSLFLDNKSYFHDTLNGMIAADTLTINGIPALIDTIDDTTGEITLVDAMSWSTNASVDLARNTSNNLGAV